VAADKYDRHPEVVSGSRLLWPDGRPGRRRRLPPAPPHTRWHAGLPPRVFGFPPLFLGRRRFREPIDAVMSGGRFARAIAPHRVPESRISCMPRMSSGAAASGTTASHHVPATFRSLTCGGSSCTRGCRVPGPKAGESEGIVLPPSGELIVFDTVVAVARGADRHLLPGASPHGSPGGRVRRLRLTRATCYGVRPPATTSTTAR
jgi:hypothetical protein